jgi:hypothetical protein
MWGTGAMPWEGEGLGKVWVPAWGLAGARFRRGHRPGRWPGGRIRFLGGPALGFFRPGPW